mmetsp:Transcript_8548/g.24319  ORF Transcript_8548/g.24319 Transcript_8548/m.24319 type:complete len:252 (-) Transcript_8548:1194-1949(-)
MRLTSSCKTSNSSVRNSWESCCSEPANWGLHFPSTFLKPSGRTQICEAWSCLSKSANASTTRPCEPSRDVRLMSCAYISERQYARKIGACDRHCTAAFRKHVFPRFARPVAGSRLVSSSSSSLEPSTRLSEDTAPLSKEGLSSSSSDNDTSSISTSSRRNRSLVSHSSHLLLKLSKRTLTPRVSDTAMTLPLRHRSVWSLADTLSPTTYRDDARGQTPSIFVSSRYVLPASSTSSHLDEGVKRRQPVGDVA